MLLGRCPAMPLIHWQSMSKQAAEPLAIGNR
jgi:hypothetical protein